ncbi:MAG: dihydrodipicolinate reductase C-terminal domain-containing protein [Bryobacteraceae bacterium]
MNLAIIGYGKMGRLIAQLAPEYNLTVTRTLDIADNQHAAGITAANLSGVDVAIDFSIPDAVLPNIKALAPLKIPVVVGTTGWTEHIEEARAAIEANQSALLWSPNYSIGVNVFFRLVAEAARSLQDHPAYGAWAWEIHHNTKKDAPSGTLLKLVDEMKQSGYTHNIDVSSNRAGAHPGTHEIGFDSPADTITLRHTARSREGFARGALTAARWLPGRQGFFEFKEVLFGKTD